MLAVKLELGWANVGLFKVCVEAGHELRQKKKDKERTGRLQLKEEVGQACEERKRKEEREKLKPTKPSAFKKQKKKEEIKEELGRAKPMWKSTK